MRTRASSIWAVAIALSGAALTGCTVHEADSPAPTGPSTFATSVNITANPDVINLGLSTRTAGQSSLIIINVFDDKGQPKANQAIRLDTFVDGIQEDCGQLQTRNLTTGTSGQVSTLFTAPGIPVPLPECTGFVIGDTVTIRATPVGTNAQAAGNATSASVRLVSPTFITPIGGLVVNFSISPITAKINQSVTFSDAGSSSPGHTITSYQWMFSDGISKSGTSVTHDFGAAGEYNVTLAITDDIGQSSFKTASITITP